MDGARRELACFWLPWFLLGALSALDLALALYFVPRAPEMERNLIVGAMYWRDPSMALFAWAKMQGTLAAQAILLVMHFHWRRSTAAVSAWVCCLLMLATVAYCLLG